MAQRLTWQRGWHGKEGDMAKGVTWQRASVLPHDDIGAFWNTILTLDEVLVAEGDVAQRVTWQRG
jgi:hypothetical protein